MNRCVLVEILVACGALLFEDHFKGILMCDPSTFDADVGDNGPTKYSLAKTNHEDSLHLTKVVTHRVKYI